MDIPNNATGHEPLNPSQPAAHNAHRSPNESPDKSLDMSNNLLDILPTGVWILDANLQVEAVNSRIEEFFGIPREELLGRDKRQLVEERIHNIFENGQEFSRRIVATYNQNTYSENFLCHILPGESRQERWLEHFSQPIRRNGEIQGRVEIYFDVTDRIQYEDELNWISTQFIQVQEKEKARIASNLHNQIGQSVIALKFSLERLYAAMGEAERAKHEEHLQTLLSQANEISRDISKISEDLLPPSLNSFGLQETLDWMVSYYKSLYDLTIDYQVLGMKDKPLDPDLEIALFRIFQEGLNNVIKHGQTLNAQCKLIYSYPRVIAIVSDQGVGFDTTRKKFGTGLRIMQRRVAELGGTLTVRSAVHEGTQLRVVIPVNIPSEHKTRVVAEIAPPENRYSTPRE